MNTVQSSYGTGTSYLLDINEIPRQIKMQVEYHKNKSMGPLVKITDDRSAYETKPISIEQVDKNDAKKPGQVRYS
jgi:hypothetical protein